MPEVWHGHVTSSSTGQILLSPFLCQKAANKICSVSRALKGIMYLAWAIYLTWFIFLIGSNYTTFKLITWKSFSAAISISGVFSFTVFSYVFIFNKGSNVAQFSESRDLWGLWFDFWIPLSLLTLLCSLCCIAAIIIRALKHDSLRQLGYFLVLLGQSLFSAFHVILRMPDA